jgi:phosphatidylinositol phospholipase C delta
VDCHDGDTEPEVYHRKTLTSRVSVRDICKAINKYAFITSPYPVIISAETHCSLEQQEMLASIMKEEFGAQLVTERLENVKGMPSPDQLRCRILLKVRVSLITLEPC